MQKYSDIKISINKNMKIFMIEHSLLENWQYLFENIV